jgi:hypothetical protein
VQLLTWQSDMVAAGIRHDAVTLNHLLGALERVNAVSDCIQLADLHERLRPGGRRAGAGGRAAGGRSRRAASCRWRRAAVGGRHLTPPPPPPPRQATFRRTAAR